MSLPTLLSQSSTDKHLQEQCKGGVLSKVFGGNVREVNMFRGNLLFWRVLALQFLFCHEPKRHLNCVC